MADKLDPQVQVRIIDLAWEMVKKEQIGDTGKVGVRRRAELFDQAYKALVKTVASKPEPPKTRRGIAL